MRLTKRYDNGIVMTENAWLRDVLQELAAYEDTGYSPLEIKSLEGEWNAMRKVVDSYRKAEEEGRLVRLPCKVGDMVYYRRGSDIIGDTVERIIIDGIDNQVLVGAHKAYMFCDFGRNVFLTRAEAEAAIKRGQDDV